MNTRNQSGAINALLLPLLAALLLLIGAVVFGAWAFGQRQDYKNNVDAKVATAVEAAKKAESATKEKEFTEREKNPLKTYVGPAEFGSVSIQYPKTWSGYVIERSQGSPFVDGYFSPGVVPTTEGNTSTFALRVQVVDQSYSDVLDTYSHPSTERPVTVQPYRAPHVPNVVGSRVDGSIFDNKTGSLVLLPLRDKTLEIWTESGQYKPDFDNIVLANLTFSP